MNSIVDESSMCNPWNIWYYDISDFQPGHTNPGSSESDLVSDKMKDLVYYSAFASNSVPSNTSTDVDSDQWPTVDALKSLRVPIKSSFIVREKTSDAQGAFFEVPAKCKDQKSILFGWMSLNQWIVKARKTILSPHSYLITSQMHVIWWRICGMTWRKGLAWTLAKEDEHCSYLLSQKGRPLTTIIKLGGG